MKTKKFLALSLIFMNFISGLAYAAEENWHGTVDVSYIDAKRNYHANDTYDLSQFKIKFINNTAFLSEKFVNQVQDDVNAQITKAITQIGDTSVCNLWDLKSAKLVKDANGLPANNMWSLTLYPYAQLPVLANSEKSFFTNNSSSIQRQNAYYCLVEDKLGNTWRIAEIRLAFTLSPAAQN